MWSLMGQHVYGKSSTYEIGIVTAAEATAATISFTEADEVAIDDDANNGIRDMEIQEYMANIKTTMATTNEDTKKITSRATTTENKGKNNNTNTIYGHINENDNNSNKLPQNVAKSQEQQREEVEVEEEQQTNMMYRNLQATAPLLFPPSSVSVAVSTSSLTPSITTLSMAALASETTASTPATLVPPPAPPTESLPMPKDQLNKTVNEIPKSNKNNKTSVNGNKPEENSDELKMSTLKVNDTNENNNNNNNKVLEKQINNETNETNLNNTSPADTIDDNADEKNITQESDPELNNVRTEQSKGFDSVAHAQQELIAQFALKFKKIPRVTFFTCKELEDTDSDSKEKMDKSSDSYYYKRHTNFNLEMVEFIQRMYVPDGDSSGNSDAPSLMMKVVLIDHLLSKNRASTTKTVTRGGFGRGGAFGGGAGAGNSGPATRNSFTNANWLEQILKTETLRQLVVLNLNCGESSRRLLEMVRFCILK